MNTFVTFEIAKLLKKKGFDTECEYYYNKEGKMLVDIDFPLSPLNKRDIYYNSPTIAEVVDWLYKKHRIWISVVVWEDAPHFLSKVFTMNNFTESKNVGSFNSPTEAYQEAIKHSLTTII